MSETILYDLPSKHHCACWSYNPWKTRLMLNLKGIPYVTEWLEYPTVAPTLKSYGLPPNAEGASYTIPAARIGSREYFMDSRKIATELERRYPSPPLHLDSPVLPKIEALIPKILAAMRGAILPKIPGALLNPPSVEYFERTRAERFGKPLAQVARESSEEKAWMDVEPVLKEIGSFLRAEGGPFVLGETVSYADLVIVSTVQFLKRIDENLYKKAMEIEPALQTVYDASKAWLQRDDH